MNSALCQNDVGKTFSVQLAFIAYVAVMGEQKAAAETPLHRWTLHNQSRWWPEYGECGALQANPLSLGTSEYGDDDEQMNWHWNKDACSIPTPQGNCSLKRTGTPAMQCRLLSSLILQKLFRTCYFSHLDFQTKYTAVVLASALANRCKTFLNNSEWQVNIKGKTYLKISVEICFKELELDVKQQKRQKCPLRSNLYSWCAILITQQAPFSRKGFIGSKTKRWWEYPISRFEVWPPVSSQQYRLLVRNSLFVCLFVCLFLFFEVHFVLSL